VGKPGTLHTSYAPPSKHHSRIKRAFGFPRTAEAPGFPSSSEVIIGLGEKKTVRWRVGGCVVTTEATTVSWASCTHAHVYTTSPALLSLQNGCTVKLCPWGKPCERTSVCRSPCLFLCVANISLTHATGEHYVSWQIASAGPARTKVAWLHHCRQPRSNGEDVAPAAACIANVLSATLSTGHQLVWQVMCTQAVLMDCSQPIVQVQSTRLADTRIQRVKLSQDDRGTTAQDGIHNATHIRIPPPSKLLSDNLMVNSCDCRVQTSTHTLHGTFPSCTQYVCRRGASKPSTRAHGRILRMPHPPDSNGLPSQYLGLKFYSSKIMPREAQRVSGEAGLRCIGRSQGSSQDTRRQRRSFCGSTVRRVVRVR
jgi:hypothetical protein